MSSSYPVLTIISLTRSLQSKWEQCFQEATNRRTDNRLLLIDLIGQSVNLVNNNRDSELVVQQVLYRFILSLWIHYVLLNKFQVTIKRIRSGNKSGSEQFSNVLRLSTVNRKLLCNLICSFLNYAVLYFTALYCTALYSTVSHFMYCLHLNTLSDVALRFLYKRKSMLAVSSLLNGQAKAKMY